VYSPYARLIGSVSPGRHDKARYSEAEPGLEH
jgi:hypothetical protein